MIGVSRLLCGTTMRADGLRYGQPAGSVGGRPHSAAERKPVVVWNCTRACNLACAHCYYSARARQDPDELSTDEARRMIDDLAQYGVPVLLFSGGEPLLRDDLFALGAYAVARGLHTVISTNGTLIDQAMARRIRAAGFSYVGISLDGMRDINDRFRGRQGAFDAALAGIGHCKQAGVRVGLRLTLNRHNVGNLDAIFSLLERERIPRACFYHLVYAGRGQQIRADDLTPAETRAAMDMIFARTEDFHACGVPCEILTVDNHTDGPYLLQRVQARWPERTDEVLEMLRWNGGNASGSGIADIDHLGRVHADQFWQHYSFGNVRERPFSEIWGDTRDPLLAGLRDRKPRLHGRCSRCRYLDLCNGNLRVRAEAVYGDPWAPDPACYLTEKELLA